MTKVETSMMSVRMIICEAQDLYNTRRPHRGKDIGNNILDVDFTPTLKGNVKCREQLGGIIKDYYRDQDAA